MPVNITLLLLAGILVVLMHAGLALVFTGLCRAKNAAQVITTNLVICVFSVLGFWAFGFALMSAAWPSIRARRGWWGIGFFSTGRRPTRLCWGGSFFKRR